MTPFADGSMGARCRPLARRRSRSPATRWPHAPSNSPPAPGPGRRPLERPQSVRGHRHESPGRRRHGAGRHPSGSAPGGVADVRRGGPRTRARSRRPRRRRREGDLRHRRDQEGLIVRRTLIPVALLAAAARVRGLLLARRRRPRIARHPDRDGLRAERRPDDLRRSLARQGVRRARVEVRAAQSRGDGEAHRLRRVEHARDAAHRRRPGRRLRVGR